MKVQPSPTSPKVRVDEDKSSPSRWRRILVVSILSGMIGGVLALALLRVALTYYSSSPFLKFFRLPQETEVRIIQETKTVAEEQSELRDLRERVLPQTLALFTRKNTGQIQDVFTAENFLGYAVIVTSDGLALTHSGVIQDPVAPLVAVTHDHRQFDVKDVSRDPASRFIFFSIDASDLSVAQFGNPEDETLGSTVFLVSHSGLAKNGAILPTALQGQYVTIPSSFQDALLTAEDLRGEFMISTPFTSSLNGAPISTADGKILGLSTSGESALARGIPVSHVLPIFDNVIQGKSIERPRLGVQYIDLAQALNIPDTLRDGRTSGALLVRTAEHPAVITGGPADRAGLQEGDILLAVDGVSLSGRVRLQDEIQKHRAGDTLQISYVRDGLSKEGTVTLDMREPL
ncbi:MAG: PDZ domain-containing protein [Candidatus Kerfeldbacteria bacterium]|nr:PDZ domain-containing protein [Candidatus Kerfeldbacteria bacterium]